MRVAVISDTHGNLVALDAVLADLDATGPYDEIVMAGDLAYGGPFPGECVERIRERGYRTVRGNTDEFITEAATGGARPSQLVDEAERESAVGTAHWFVERMATEDLDFLADLPLRLTVSDGAVPAFEICHATPWSAHETVKPDVSDDVAIRMLDVAGSQALAYGHIHVQYERHVDGRLLAAIGAVGLPFDGDQRAAYAVFSGDTDGWSVEFRRVPYDVDAAVKAIDGSGAPTEEVYIRRLRTARQ